MREHALRGLCYNVTAMPPRIFRFGLLVLGAALCGAVMAGRAAPGHSTGDARAVSAESRRETLLIFPFENESRMANLDWLGEGLSELTTERLEDRGVNVLSREDRLSTLEKMGLPDSARFSHATIIKIAAEADGFDEEVRQLLFGKGRGQYRVLFSIRGSVIRIHSIQRSARSRLEP